MDYSKIDRDYDECVEQLKEAILLESRKYNKLINPLNSDSKNVLGIMCTWNQMFKAFELAETEWNKPKTMGEFLKEHIEDNINPYEPLIKQVTKVCKDLDLCCKDCGEVLKQDWTDLKKPMYCKCKENSK